MFTEERDVVRKGFLVTREKEEQRQRKRERDTCTHTHTHMSVYIHTYVLRKKDLVDLFNGIP